MGGGKDRSSVWESARRWREVAGSNPVGQVIPGRTCGVRRTRTCNPPAAGVTGRHLRGGRFPRSVDRTGPAPGASGIVPGVAPRRGIVTLRADMTRDHGQVGERSKPAPC